MEFIAELTEHSPVIIQNSSDPLSRKNLDVRPYDHTTVQGATLTCEVNYTVGTPTPQLCSIVQWSLQWALSQTIQVLVLARAGCFALETCGEKKCKLHF